MGEMNFDDLKKNFYQQDAGEDLYPYFKLSSGKFVLFVLICARRVGV